MKSTTSWKKCNKYCKFSTFFLVYINEDFWFLLIGDKIGLWINVALLSIPCIWNNIFKKMFCDNYQDLLIINYLGNVAKIQLVVTEVWTRLWFYELEEIMLGLFEIGRDKQKCDHVFCTTLQTKLGLNSPLAILLYTTWSYFAQILFVVVFVHQAPYVYRRA